MKIFLANQSKQKLGGGFTFLNTFEKYLNKLGVDAVSITEDANFASIRSQQYDILFISGATMVTRNVLERAKAAGFKIVLRVDNIPRNSRNRNTGTSRLYDFAQMADLVIYQSEWAKEFIAPFLRTGGPVILNGADTEIFNPGGTVRPAEGMPQCLYVQYNRDETKQWHHAWYEFQMMLRKNKDAHLWIVGNFSPETRDNKFDFFGGAEKRYEYLGLYDNPEDMAEAMRGAHFLYLPYYNDACSNTLIEFRQCHPEGRVEIAANMTGGTPEILDAPLEQLTAEHMTKRYLEEIGKIL